ncbi:LCP family protein [Amycolatopsis benzoatilytica]|uniref:LCP family protein n=1 Tax=Amycolatopsis benzoatilytica TaxID=346045 RepID=UPI00037F97D6|nr:LCP family protein [Amycolatopsis benzoatilytica]
MSERAKGHWAERVGVVALVAVLLGGAGYGWVELHSLLSGVTTSTVLDGRVRPAGDTNILVMGLDSRLDERGDPLPAQLYEELHAGDQQVGGYHTDVLMLLHVPADGGHPTVISIARDDLADFPGCPGGVCRGAIKEAYGYAFAAESKLLAGQGIVDRVVREQRARDAGRAAEIAAVRQFLGGVPVDHFLEVTLVAFFQLAQVVEPITVCLAEDTRDSASGADFRRGPQQISAAQALAFVRQRQDPDHDFTDLDRERRQQAFLVSVAHQLKEGRVFGDPAELGQLVSVAQRNVAVDSGLDLNALVHQAESFAGGDLTLSSLPVERFGKDERGNDVNIVDPAKVHAAAARLLGRTTPPPPAATAGPGVDVVNASGREGAAARLVKTLPSRGYRAGRVTSAHHLRHTVVRYGSGDSAAAAKLVATLGGGYDTGYDDSLAAGELKLVLGTDFRESADQVDPVPVEPASPSDEMTGGGVPCVR